MSSHARLRSPTPLKKSGPERIVESAESQIKRAQVPEPAQEARGRRYAHAYLLSLLAAIVAFVVLGVLAHSTTTLLGFDAPITRAIQGVHLPGYAWILTHTSDLGFSPLNVVSYLVVFGAFFAVGLRMEAVLAVLSSALAGLVGGLVKQAVGRLRPAGYGVHVVGHISGYSFPSGHVTQYTTLFGFSFFLVLVTWRGGWLRTAVLVLLGLLILLVGPSRVYLGQHWPSDVLGAYLYGAVWLAGTIELHLLLKRRLSWWSGRSERQPRQGKDPAINSGRR